MGLEAYGLSVHVFGVRGFRGCEFGGLEIRS